eukprot:CAMPEP_0184298264 /NCGR_PEP_ID=MMETSP1049-20130417/9101_1 /TAXON_ID=77928 /ORGANISM="Proteomonas sulcata, Strain CCMP704" /LENGTH=388 /DNA_ID=CAMNT_0026608339 /DNA_START=23 /DNA_END=1190 /DNA_ORIENTATION=+
MSKAAKDALAAQLDALMGKERDVAPEQRTGRTMHFTDERLDRYWLCGLSPYILFRNTRSDLGAWDKITDDDAKEDWDKLSQEEKDDYGYEYDLFRYLEQLVGDLDKNIKRQKDKLENDRVNKTISLSKETQAQVDALAAQIKELQTKAQELGEEGNVDESMSVMKEVEELQAKKTGLENPQFPGKEKVMEVCEVCCNFMANTDSDVRKAEHLAGKQHGGWQKIRDKLIELKARNDGKGPLPAKSKRPPSATGNGRERERSKDRDRSKERHRDRDGGGTGTGTGTGTIVVIETGTGTGTGTGTDTTEGITTGEIATGTTTGTGTGTETETTVTVTVTGGTDIEHLRAGSRVKFSEAEGLREKKRGLVVVFLGLFRPRPEQTASKPRGLG